MAAGEEASQTVVVEDGPVRLDGNQTQSRMPFAEGWEIEQLEVEGEEVVEGQLQLVVVVAAVVVVQKRVLRVELLVDLKLE
jgi:hypothetical protein